MKRMTKCAAGGVVALILLLTGPQVAFAAAGSDSSATPTTETQASEPQLGQEVRIGRSLADSVLLGVTHQEPQEDPSIGTMSIPLNPGDVYECDFANNADHVVIDLSTFPYTNGSITYWSGGDIDLLCGTDTTSGYKHIRARHQWPVGGTNSWEGVRQSASDALGYTSPQSWDEFMIHAVQDTLDYSDPAPFTLSGNKVCFSAPFYIWKGSQIYARYYANTIVSKNNYIIVTAYLSNNSQASACRQEF